jgi:asparagine synthase (glutamine-hydrolysing)
MCGIAGIVCPDGIRIEDLPAMGAALEHRGPDSLGYLLHSDEEGTRVHRELPVGERLPSPSVGFAHRRLAIIDVSEENDQPMVDPSGRYALTYNGEIYNYVELREELASLGHRFGTSGDTEVVLRAYVQWGEACVERMVGMWAFAILDVERRAVFFSRDRFGIKPLYFTIVRGAFYFASEIKGLLATGAIEAEPEERVVASFLVDSLLDDSERTFFRGISQLRPAHNLTVGLDSGLSPQARRYWQVRSVERSTDANPPARFRGMLEDSIRVHARSDVPVGTCLSGGLDSSGIVCLAEVLRRAGEIPQYAHQAFGYVPDDQRFSERAHMQEVVANTDVRMAYVAPTNAEFAAELPEVLRQQDEPFGSASIAAQWFVFRAARAAGMKVMLDGQGADEVLGGYVNYLPTAGTSLLRTGRLIDYWRFAGAYRRRFGALPTPAAAIVADLAPTALWRIRRALGGPRREPGAAAIATPWLRDLWRTSRVEPFPARTLNELLAREVESTSLPALLRYEDRNSMAHSIEARVPFLDHRLVEFAFSLPGDWKIRDLTTKRVLREALCGVIPEAIRTRTDKVGFRADPDVTWNLARRHRDAIISRRTPWEERWFDEGAVRSLIDSGDRSAESEFLLWRVVSIKSWLRATWGDSVDLLG